MDEDQIGSCLADRFFQGDESAGGEVGERLIVAHQGEVEVWLDPEGVEGFLEHLLVLAGHEDDGLVRRGASEPPNDGRHLDGFRPSAEDGGGFHGRCGLRETRLDKRASRAQKPTAAKMTRNCSMGFRCRSSGLKVTPIAQ
jgi:hypothetical protein